MTSYSVTQVIETFLEANVMNVMQGLMLIAAGIAVLHLGMYFALRLTNALKPIGDKPKREPTSYFEDPTEPDFAPVDYVVGIGDDGEMVFASEKRKNDEVIE